MKRLLRRAPLPALVLLLGLSSNATAQATERPWSIQFTGGIVLPTGEYATSTNPGLGLAGSVGYALTPDWSLLASFNAGFLEGDLGPDWNIYTYFLKAAYDTGEGDTKWRILVPLGAGAVTFAPDSDAISSSTYLGLNSGLMFQYYLNPRLAFTFDGLVTFVFASKSEIGSDTLWLFPLGAGLLLRF